MGKKPGEEKEKGAPVRQKEKGGGKSTEYSIGNWSPQISRGKEKGGSLKSTAGKGGRGRRGGGFL